MYYAQNATISCSDSAFTGKDEEGEIHLAVSGGEVRIDVACGTEWIVYNDNSDVFGTDATSNSLTVSAGQNLVKSERTGTIYLMTRWYRIIFATITVTQDAYGAPEITIDTNEWHVPAVGVLSTEIAVDANGEWTAESNAEWLTIAKTENAITLTAAQNPETTERTAEVVLACDDGYNSASQKIMVTQDALAYINLGAEELTVYAYEYTTTFKVESNFDWDCTCSSDWLTVEKSSNGKSIILTWPTNYDTSDRETILTITAGDGAENVTEVEFRIIQEGCATEKALILEYDFSSTDQNLKLPLESVTYAIIDWGDGERETVFSDYPSHKYSSSGTYYVTINGIVEHIQSYVNYSLLAGAASLAAVVQWGDLELTSMRYGFCRCTKLASLPEGPGPFSNVTSFYYCFSNCSKLEYVPEKIFQKCTSVTTFAFCFYYCTALTSAPSFRGCISVTNFEELFYYCTSLTTVPEDMFSGCIAVTILDWVFCKCYKLTSVPLFDDCTLATNFYETFYQCSSLDGESPYTEITVGGETVKVHLYERENYPEYFTTPTRYKECFYGATSFSDYDDIPSGWK